MADSLLFPDARATVEALISLLRAEDRTVIGPVVRDGAIVLDELSSVADLPIGWTDDQEAGRYRLRRRDDEALFGYAVGAQSPRRWLSPPRRSLWSARRTDDGELLIDLPSTSTPHLAFLGVRACELAAVAVQDRVFRDGPYVDDRYAAARDDAFFVGVSCGSPAATCFCASMGTGPEVTAGADLSVTELVDAERHELVVIAGTDAGRSVLTELGSVVEARPVGDADRTRAAGVVERSVALMTRRLDPEQARIVLRANLEHPRWDDVASRCLSCTNCTLVCPTCFCSATEDVTGLDGATAERVQRWDSCFTLDHSWLHGTGPVRGDTRARYRQWLTHKLSTWWDQYDVSGCVGCGRCIAWCPAGIDLTEEVAAMTRAASNEEALT